MDIDSVLKTHGIGATSGIIKSIQKGSIFLYNKPTVITIKIAQVIEKNTIVRIYKKTDRGSNVHRACAIKLKDATTIEIFQKANSLDNLYWEVIEFSNAFTKQTGEFAAGIYDSDVQITISKVNLKKTLLFFTYVFDFELDSLPTQTETAGNYIMYGDFLNDTTIKFNWYREGGDPVRKIYWQVIEFI